MCDRWMVTFKLLCTVIILIYINITIYKYQQKSSVPKSNYSSWNAEKNVIYVQY
jgi:uncharacterized protein (UPF0333 family)